MSKNRDRDRRELDRRTAERLLRRQRTPRATSGDFPDDAGTSPLAALDRLLAAAAEPPAADPEAARVRQEAALAAFRAAQRTDAGAVPRPQDEWRRSRRRGVAVLGARTARVSRSAKVLTGALVAAVALGGVAVAAGTGAIPDPFGTADSGSRPTPARSAPADPSGETGPGGTAQAPTPGGNGVDGPTAGDPAPGTSKKQAAVGMCRAYRAAAESGDALNSEAFGRLADAAGGERAVDGYCARLLREDRERRGKPEERAKPENSESAGKQPKEDEVEATETSEPPESPGTETSLPLLDTQRDQESVKDKTG
ncbi:hypothetical protein [Streptomyces sp. 7N604]|uniref:hypothetical protein n=1 Tax=Streptomyces sp. 7N604 TaxID=3457415 RepID=UPI003FD1BAFA